jgi:hypothetical protein
MAKIKWDTSEFIAACIGVTMNRLEAAAHIIADDAKSILASQINPRKPPHAVIRAAKKAIWEERSPGALIRTIRVTRKKDSSSRNVWIMAGNFKTWWAIQTEYGRGGWKGGRKSFLRPAMAKAHVAIQSCLEGGSGQTKEFEGYK